MKRTLVILFLSIIAAVVPIRDASAEWGYAEWPDVKPATLPAESTQLIVQDMKTGDGGYIAPWDFIVNGDGTCWVFGRSPVFEDNEVFDQMIYVERTKDGLVVDLPDGVKYQRLETVVKTEMILDYGFIPVASFIP